MEVDTNTQVHLNQSKVREVPKRRAQQRETDPEISHGHGDMCNRCSGKMFLVKEVGAERVVQSE